MIDEATTAFFGLAKAVYDMRHCCDCGGNGFISNPDTVACHCRINLNNAHDYYERTVKIITVIMDGDLNKQ